ncbi:hypothetical protein CYMTET_41752 [Cymbomonas tetramitiformis]|uniref:Thioredoxin domain-containing protein n=1 Tax=Cymbomonas tetramitiformis TaxID=36881 RepID=A0AAE0C6X5_9CHLO|nr:hypothetical protein CYMTET_41752 [Cymbomonas tetramitiformis]
MGLADIIGSQLLQKDSKVEVESLKGKVVGLYFSAHWCPPCRGFTPKLAEQYKALQAAGKPFEIVFISSDKSQDQFNEYYAEMPWLALPYEDRDRKAKLSKKFKVSGIPSLVILDDEGKVITTDGRGAVTDSEFIANFPWSPPTLEDVLGDRFVDQDGKDVTLSSLTSAGKNIGLYFSAHWCPPCKGFTPKLAETYKKLQADGKPFEVIFVSSDRDEEGFKEYFGEMPWLALPFSERKQKERLSQYFDVSGIPSFVMLSPELKVIDKNARGAVAADPEGKDFPWYPKPVTEIDACESINDTPTVCLMLEGCDESTQTSMEDLLLKVSKEVRASLKEDEEMNFCLATKADGLGGRVRQLTKMEAPGGKAELIVLDVGNEGSYYVHKGAVDESTLKIVIEDFRAENLDMAHLG